MLSHLNVTLVRRPPSPSRTIPATSLGSATAEPHEERTKRHSNDGGTHDRKMSRLTLRRVNTVPHMDRQFRSTECSQCG